MKRYFLLIDPQKNTVRIPVDDEFIKDALKNKEVMQKIKKHKTKKELESEVSDYLKGEGKTE